MAEKLPDNVFLTTLDAAKGMQRKHAKLMRDIDRVRSILPPDFAASAFSIPLIYDGRATLVSGVVASVRAVFGRFGVMMCWAFLLAAVIMGSIMALPLLLVSLPVMAYASRELYYRVFPLA